MLENHVVEFIGKWKIGLMYGHIFTDRHQFHLFGYKIFFELVFILVMKDFIILFLHLLLDIKVP